MEVARRVRALTGSALRMGQVGNDGDRYLGSGLLVRRTAEAVGCARAVSCPPVADTDVRGESKYHAEVVLAGRPLLTQESAEDVAILAGRLTSLVRQLARVLRLPVAGVDFRVVRWSRLG